jgi:hypothetical protein
MKLVRARRSRHQRPQRAQRWLLLVVACKITDYVDELTAAPGTRLLSRRS